MPLRGWNGTQAVPYEMDEPCAVEFTAKYYYLSGKPSAK